jgi:hypothetical protein
MWIYIPNPASTSSPSALEAEASTSASNWQSHALAQSCWWRGKPSRQQDWSRRLSKVSWLQLLSGRMPEPSTADSCAAAWMASLAASHVSRIPHAGRRGGASDPRDLWAPNGARRIIVQARPWFVLIENVAGMLTAQPGETPGAERVWRDLQRLGFEVEGGLFEAPEVGGTDERQRLFILGVAQGNPEGFGRGERNRTKRVQRMGGHPLPSMAGSPVAVGQADRDSINGDGRGDRRAGTAGTTCRRP